MQIMRILSISLKLKKDFLLMCESMSAAKQNTFIIETNKSEHFLTVSRKFFTACFPTSGFHKCN